MGNVYTLFIKGLLLGKPPNGVREADEDREKLGQDVVLGEVWL